MELLNQHAKKIMEGCKARAREAGLSFSNESLEYIVTNRDMLALSPKLMIPNLYDYWVHDVELLKEKGRYSLYPSNPYETVINTRPPISFYNDNNPDWLNVMIFYHVLAHIDFFQNNLFFRHTWEYDFNGRALSDKRMITKLRAEKGRWVDYVIEFARGIDNLVGFYQALSHHFQPPAETLNTPIVDYYFDIFLQSQKQVPMSQYVAEIERYNQCMRETTQQGEATFFATVKNKYPEFNSLYKKHLTAKTVTKPDLLQFMMTHSPFLQQEKNQWMCSILSMIRETSLYFQPQIRTKIINEGWASYWHERLFLADDRIKGHEVDFARVNAKVTSMLRVGLNPYGLGMRLFSNLETLGDQGKRSLAYDRLTDAAQRQAYDQNTHAGQSLIFQIRENYNDYLFINEFIDQDFVDRYQLFTTGKRFNQERMSYQYYVKSRQAKAYKKMVADALYHPPDIEIGLDKNNRLYLNHRFEGKPLVKDYIHNTLLGVEYLWGGPVKLETSEAELKASKTSGSKVPSTTQQENPKQKIHWRRYCYTMNNRQLSKRVIF